MSNGARHGFGLLIGLLLTPVLRLGTMYGTQRLGAYGVHFDTNAADRYIGLGILAGVAILLAFLVGSRLSPLASLVPGLIFVALAVAWVAAPVWSAENILDRLPETFSRNRVLVSSYETILGVLGGVLLFSSLFPSRWRARHPKPTAQQVAAQAQAFNGPGHVRPLVPGQQSAQVQIQPQGQAPSPYGPPPGPGPATGPAPAAPGSAPSPRPGLGTGPQESSGAGEWTRMYGGDDLKGRR